MFDKIIKLLKIKFSTSVTLIDGTPLELSGDLDTGTNVSVITEDGPIPLPDGEYKLSDESIIMVKDGLIVDIIEPSTPETDETNDKLDAPVKENTDELATQKGNPEVSGEEPVKEDEMPTATGTTETTETEVKAEDVVIEEPVVEGGPDKVAELEAKVAAMSDAIAEIMAKLNLISEKFSSAQPIIKKKEDNVSTIDPKLQSKVDLIKRLKKG